MGMRSEFVEIDGTSVHVRLSGQVGPPLLLLHQAPTSARILESRLELFGSGFQCIAPDIPGLGQSDALDESPVTIEKLARFFVRLLEHLGVKRALLYGSHTGALVATEIAIQRPDLAVAVVTNGYPIYTREESAQRLATYFPHLEPDWDGSHLVWLWYRYREQFLYWPWNTKDPGTRAHCAVPGPEYLHRGVAEIALRHDCYAQVYAAAFGYDAAAGLKRISVPMHLVIEDEDSLSLKIGHATDANGSLKLHPCSTAKVEETEHAVLTGAAAGHESDAQVIAMPQASERRRFKWDGGHLLARLLRGPGDLPAVVVFPPFPAGSAAILPELPPQLGRDVILIDLERLPDTTHAGAALDSLAAATERILDTFGISRADVIVHDDGRALATALLRSRRIARLLVIETGPARPARDTFDGAFCPSGGHLLRLWDRLRFAGLGDAGEGRHESLERLGRLSWTALASFQDIPAWDGLLANAAEHPDEGRTLTLKVGVHASEVLAAAPSPNVGYEPGPPSRPLAAALRMLSGEQGR